MFNINKEKMFLVNQLVKEKAYWFEKMSGNLEYSSLPNDLYKSEKGYVQEMLEFDLPKEISQKLISISGDSNYRLHMLFTTVILVLVGKYTGNGDIILGSTIYKETQNEEFINTIFPIRCNLSNNISFKDLLLSIRQTINECVDNQNYPFEILLLDLNISENNKFPIFDVMVLMENIQDLAHVEDVNTNVKFIFKRQDNKIKLFFNYNASLYSKVYIKSITENLFELLSIVTEDINAEIFEMDMLAEEEKKQLLESFNMTKVDYPRNLTIQTLLEEQAAKTPNKDALVYEGKSLTYGKLNERVNSLARILRKKGAKQESIVALMVKPSLEMIIGVIGIIKSGAAYMPIDPEYPEERIRYMLMDCGAKLLLTEKKLKNTADRYETEIIEIDAQENYKLQSTNIKNISKPENLAYVIYTSGTTGKPKGTEIEHKSLLNQSLWHKDYYEIDETTISTKYASIGFDASVLEIFPYLISGSTLHIISEDIRLDVKKLNQYYEENGVTISFLPTQLCEQFMEEENHSLKKLLTAGDKLNGYKKKSYKLINNYGPTENGVVATYYELKEWKENIPIGKPTANTTIYILDKDLQLQPICAAGEIYISGMGLARGYLNLPELTSEKFVSSPFREGERMYRTGDRGRWLPDGNIEFLGRVDYQVKIRGYRIELGEIESRLLAHEAIKEVVIAVKSDDSGDKYLTAYFIAEKKLIIGELRDYLKNNLPMYMVPPYFVQLDKMPLTTNGKIDKRALPEPDGMIDTGVEYVAPGNEIEEKLVEIWRGILKVERIGIHDNFFELGGHSLKSIVLASKIQEGLEVKVSIMEIFKLPTIKELAEHINGCQKSQYYSIKPADKREYYPVTSVQRRLYILQNIDLGSTAYNMPQVLVLEGNIDKGKMKNAFHKLILHHEILRTSFEFIEGNILQRIHDEFNFNIECYEKDEEQKINFIVRNFIRPFDLSKAPLIRVGLIKITSQKFILMTDMHHIVSDGTSIQILIDDFIRLYEGKELNELKLQYKDYAVWHNEILKKQEVQDQEKYWIEQFKGKIPVLSMPTNKTRPLVKGSQGDNYSFTVEEKLSKNVKEFALRKGTTVFMVLLEAFSLTLSKYSEQEDIIIGTVTAGREHVDIQNLIGLFLNSIAFRCQPVKAKTAGGYLQEIKEIVLKGYENQSYPFEEIIDKLNCNRDLSRNALFDVMLVYQNFEKQKESVESMNFSISNYDSDYYSADYDMTMYVNEVKDRLEINILYYSEIFEKAFIERFAVHFSNILKELITYPEKKLQDINMLSEEEARLLIKKFNNTKAVYPRDKTLHELFEEQVEIMPENIAVVYKDVQLTYQELNKKSNQLAEKLRQQGLSPNNIVGVMAEKSVEMTIGILAVLKSGGAYLPIDPVYPKERIKYMLEDCGVEILLIQEKFIQITDFKGQIINLEDERVYDNRGTNLQLINKSSDLAYVIYTSGTTGQPKGIMTEHRNVIAYITEFNRKFEIGADDTTLQQASITFDGFNEEMYTVLTKGGKVVIPDKDQIKEASELKKLIDKHQVTILSCSPLILNQFNILKPMVSVHTYLSSSDVLKKEYYSNIIKYAKVYNMYGPTETTVCTTCYQCTGEEDNVPIGKPLANYKVYILEENKNVLPIGVIGEIYISGEGVSRGYINKPQLTKERFIADPFLDGGLMYRTGDLGRWLPDGNIEFLGRIDYQVKIRGYRIELGEIENMLLAHEEVKEAVIAVKSDNSGDKYLTAYFIANIQLTVRDLREYLNTNLPDYMIPSYFVQLDHMPLTPNGKIDKKELPEPEGEIHTGVEYVSPRNEVEIKLAELWQDILKVKRIGINDNFFELGGHSLKATILLAKIQKELEVKVPLKEIFAKPSIKDLAQYINRCKKSKYYEIKPADKKTYYPVSSVQRRLYTLQHIDLDSTSYNMPQVFILEGNIDKGKIVNAFHKLILRHEILRTCFEFVEGEILQKIHDSVDFNVEYYEEDKKNEDRISFIVKSFIRSFNLNEAPLIRVGLIKMTLQKYILMTDMHHIVSDGTSIQILMDDFIKLYEGKELDELKLQYKDYAVWQSEMLKEDEVQEQEKYWLKEFTGEIPVLNMPVDNVRPAIRGSEGDNYSFTIDEKILAHLKEFALKNGATIFMVLLEAFSLTLSKYSGQEDIIIGTVTAGRDHADIQNLIGVFLNSIAFRCIPEKGKTAECYLQEIKETVLKGYENQSYPFEELINKLSLNRDLSRNALFDVMLIYQNFEKQEESAESMDFSIDSYEADYFSADYDVTMYVDEIGDKLEINVLYYSEIFERTSIERFADHFTTILKKIIEKPDRKLEKINMMSEKEKRLVLEEFNNTDMEYPRDKSIKELVEEVAEKFSHKVAVVFEEEELTYQQLNEKSNQLARILRNKGIENDCIVGIMLERSVEMVVAAVAVLKSGGAYLAIDTDYPEDRIKYMIKDSKVKVLLTDYNQNERTADLESLIINVKDCSVYEGGCSNLESLSRPEDLAYIIYTSGTTGLPKGVMVEQRNLLNMVYAWKKSYQLEEFDVSLLQIASMSFDVFPGDLMRVLTNGGKMVICPKEARLDPAEFYNLIQKYGINIFETTPSLALPMMEYIYENKLDISSMRALILGGDSCSVEDFRNLNERYSDTMRIINNYGIAEATIDSSFYEMNESIGSMVNLPIGKPMQNIKYYILDECMTPKAVGHFGELYVGGEGIARGYLNKPELTAERFIADPFTKKGRVYRTGDIARWLPDGVVEFAGRKDNQVKIRGFRIELGEIENSLRNLKEVNEAVVTAREDERGKYLCAYLISDNEVKLDIRALRNHLVQQIPDYMVPSYFVQLDIMPLTPNGKLDRKALPKPEGMIETGAEYQAPESEIEHKLVEIWQDILKVERIGINDSFFELGGHSLTATTLAARVQKELEVKIPLRVIFEKTTIKNLAEYIECSEKNKYFEIEQVEKKEYYPLSSAQKRIYAMQQFEIESTAYNIPAVMVIIGKLDIEKMEYVFNQLIERHESLRTSFEIVGEEIVQKIQESVNLKIEYNEVTEEEIINEKIRTFVRAFNLNKAPLFRVGVIKVNPEKQILMCDIHHIVSDGVSVEILIGEFLKLYKGENLHKLKIQYKDYAHWQNRMIQEGLLKKQEEYWMEQFRGGIPVLNMPTDYTRPVIQSFEGSSIQFEIEKELTEGIKILSQKTGSTMYMILLAVYYILLSKYSGQEDIIVGSPIAGRPHADLEKIIGMFVNTLALRNRPKSKKSFAEFLQEVKVSCLEAYEHQNYQFEELVEKLEVKRQTERNPVFDTLFVMQNMQGEATVVNGIMFKPYDRKSENVKFDLSIEAVERDITILMNIEYCSKLFNKDTVIRLAKHYTNILDQIVKNSQITIKEIDIITKEEKRQLLVEFNNTKVEYPKDKTIHGLFEEQVQKEPENTAVVFGDKKLSYRELNEKANQVANKLKENGVKADTIVAILVERSLEMVIGIYGILKAGGAYLPIDPNYPKDRIQYIIDDSKAQVVLTQERFVEKLKGEKVINLEEDGLYMGKHKNPEPVNKPTDLAYVIYTSGSTGKPKGVMIEHYSVINRINWMQKKYPIGEKDVILQKTPYTFDVSVWELMWWALEGATVAMLKPEGEKDPTEIREVIEKNKVTTMHFVPSMLNAYLEYLKLEGDTKSMKSLKQVFASGEALTGNQVQQFNKLINKETGARLHNLYGPTEATVDVSYYDCPETEAAGTIPIGKPIDNIELYILDKNNNLQPIGIPGELHIAGDGLARGYLNRPELTAEKFVANPIRPEHRMYKTGDLARWLPDGNIEFLGRIDYQVKIRGNRIELGEIENKLLEHEGIKDAVVIAREESSGEKYLCAYIVGIGEEKLTVGELREYLGKGLPEYMIPSYFMLLDKIPVTTSGKVDRKSLPQIGENIRSETKYEAPTNEIEEKLVEIWQQILNTDRIGINDNYFELGGHSLKATVIVARIQKELGVQLAIKEIFFHPTVKSLAKIIEGLEVENYKGILPAEIREFYPVSSIQKRMFIINQFDKNEIVYNMPIITAIEGEVDRQRLEEAFQQLVERHDAFRTTFEFQGEEIVQRIHEKTNYKLEYYEANEETARQIVKDFIRPFNLNIAPLIRTALIKLEEEKHILMVDMHHIISDGTSIEIIMEEFAKLYYGMELEPLTIQYKDYAVWQNQENIKKQLKKQEEYWMEVFKDQIPVLNLPTDYKRPKILTYEGDSYVKQINKELMEKIRELAIKNGTTLFTILLAIYSITLSKYSSQEDIVIGTVTAGRTREEVQSTIGVFLNNIAFRCKPKKEKTFEEYLNESKEDVVKGYENQEYPIEELIEKLNLTRDMSRNTLFDTMIILQNYESRTRNINLGEIRLKDYDYDSKVSRYDITLTIFENEDGLILSYEYFTRLFKPQTIERLADHMVKIADEITEEPQKKLKDIEMLSEKEMQQAIREFNLTKIEYPKDKTVHQLIEEQVERYPDKIAVEYKEQKITYLELNQKSNQLARMLRKKGVKRESIVGIIVDRSVEMVVTALAVMKAGGAYLAIDSEYPKDRMEYMLNDSEVKILLTQKNLVEEISFQGEIIDVKDQRQYQGDGTNLNNINSLNDLIYMIYTSGTTGKPKGVMVEHKNLLNMAYAWKKDYKLDEFEVRLLQIASMSFDVFPGDITRTLTNGGSMIICSSEARIDPAALQRLIKEKKINIFETTPALVIPLMEYAYENNLDMNSLQTLIMGGDSCSVDEFNKLNKRYKNIMRIINNYGVAEATIDSSYYEAQELLKGTGNVTIGKPMQNIRYYILDEDKKPKAVGHYGELYIAGDGVARGYKNNPELTAEKFMADLFTAGERMYKTGDIARWMQDGNIDFLGRSDNQIKIRGYRIELGEIESSLLGYGSIKEAVVTAIDEPEEKYLCAYITAEEELDVAKIKKYLGQSLPGYMIPVRYIQLEKLPLTPNGKIDRKALPMPEGSIKVREVYESASNETEAKLVSIWEQLLKLDTIGINDNFFELGGHSLKATVLVGRIKKEFNMEFPLKEIFKTPTIKALSLYIEKNKQQQCIKGAEDMILLKKADNADRNLFLIHDITCEVSGYREFCSVVNIDINCWGIRAAMNKGYCPENFTIEEIAEEYIKKINAVQKQGPYCLGGWSIGGTIAFEVARQLEEKGEKIEKLWIFDAEAPCATSTRHLQDKSDTGFTVDREKAFISSFLPKSTVPETIKRGETIDEIWYETIRYMETYGLDAEKIKKFTEEYTGYIVTDIETMGLLEIIKYMNKIRSLDRALYVYKPQAVVNAPVNLIKAKESRWLKQEKWKEHTSRHIKIIEIPGNHFTIFKEPNVKEIVRIFESSFVKE